MQNSMQTKVISMDEKLRSAFQTAFQLKEAEFSNDLSPEMVSTWDSLGHLRLVDALQEQFGLEFAVEEIMAMENVGAIREVLRGRGVQG